MWARWPLFAQPSALDSGGASHVRASAPSQTRLEQLYLPSMACAPALRAAHNSQPAPDTGRAVKLAAGCFPGGSAQFAAQLRRCQQELKPLPQCVIVSRLDQIPGLAVPYNVGYATYPGRYDRQPD